MGDDSSEDGDFRSNVFSAVGLSPHANILNMNQLTLRQPSERNWLLPGEKNSDRRDEHWLHLPYSQNRRSSLSN